LLSVKPDEAPVALGLSRSTSRLACIEDPAVIQKILTRLKEKAAPELVSLLPSVWAPPVCVRARTGRPTGLFG